MDEQRHLTYGDTVNLGSYYTPASVVDTVYALLARYAPGALAADSPFFVLDTSCGYGSFLRGKNCAGADIDEAALARARETHPHAVLFRRNSLAGVSRAQYGLSEDARLIIVGNPPYNDVTSIIRSRVKRIDFPRDADLRACDLGISFLLSYEKLRAEYVCVLHPLSYLIKETNFSALKQFRRRYRLLDGLVIPSSVFSAASQKTVFPIIIALYRRENAGMDYGCIRRYRFSAEGGKRFSLSMYDTVTRYITKYPNRRAVKAEDAAAYFYTMRDINALKRAATFLPRETAASIRVSKAMLPYYCYVDVFKDYLPRVPFYFGNNDVMIDHDEFLRLRDAFVLLSLKKHPSLAPAADAARLEQRLDRGKARQLVDAYFERLLGEHAVPPPLPTQTPLSFA
ncbi:MAG: hypothetical protein LBR16_01490 [Treponema sp.]|jgi:hypothetical protein|nr:hypothetical protein [Treponema sp.]